MSIPSYAWLSVALLAAFYLGCLATALTLNVFRRPRRGGYIRPSLSASGSASPGTVERVTTYTGCKTVGPSRVVRVRLGMPAEPNRTTALTSFGSVTAIVRGDHMMGVTTQAFPVDVDPRPEAA